MRHIWLFIIIILFGAAVVGILIANKAQLPSPVADDQTVVAPPVVHDTAKPAQKDDLIVLESPLPGATVSSPLTITGKARGTWYFEGSFPVVLVDWDGKIIAQGHATAKPPAGGTWMTEEYVPFTATLTFAKTDTQVSNRGSLILKNDNPSGDPSKDKALEVEIRYQ